MEKDEQGTPFPHTPALQLLPSFCAGRVFTPGIEAPSRLGCQPSGVNLLKVISEADNLSRNWHNSGLLPPRPIWLSTSALLAHTGNRHWQAPLFSARAKCSPRHYASAQPGWTRHSSGLAAARSDLSSANALRARLYHADLTEGGRTYGHSKAFTFRRASQKGRSVRITPVIASRSFYYLTHLLR